MAFNDVVASMNGRSTFAVSALIALAALAGCVESFGFLSTTDDEVSAMAHKDLADGAAAAWASDATLVAVLAFESANASEMLPSDATVGNGLAPLWLYGYTAQNGSEYRVFQVTAAGEVATFNPRGMSEMGEVPIGLAEPIGAWSIDSNAAVDIARGNETFAAVAALEGVSFMEALGAQQGATAWAIMAGTPSAQAIAIVDAASGILLMVQSFQMDFDLPPMPMPGMTGAGFEGPQVEMEESGTLDMGTPVAEFPFTISYADSGFLAIQIQGDLPTDALSWVITDAEGEEVDSGSLSMRFSPQGSGDEWDIALEDAGEHTLTLYYDAQSLLAVGSVDFDLQFIVGMSCGERIQDDPDPSSMQMCAYAEPGP